MISVMLSHFGWIETTNCIYFSLKSDNDDEEWNTFICQGQKSCSFVFELFSRKKPVCGVGVERRQASAKPFHVVDDVCQEKNSRSCVFPECKTDNLMRYISFVIMKD